MRWLAVLFPVFLSAVALAAERVVPAQEAVPASAVPELGGFLGERVRANTEYLLRFDVDRFVRMVEERRYRDWFWIGEQPGKWFEAALYAIAQSGSAELRKKAEEVLRRLVAAQEPSGYLGITDPKVRTDRRPLRGMDAYELYFTLHALVTAWEQWHDEAALGAAKRLGDYFVEKIGTGKAEFYPVPKEVTIAGHPEHFGLEGALLAHPMARLGRVAGDAKYLDWSRWAVGSIDRWSGCDTLSNLDKVASGEMRLNQIQPNVHAHTLHMNLLSLLELHQASGDEALLRKVRAAWRDIVTYRLYITGGVSVAEVYRPDFELPNTGNIVETCATMSWMLLNQRLLEWTGEPHFADVVERLLWNHLPAAQTVDSRFAAKQNDGDGWRYHTPLAGWKPDGCFTGPDCCSSSGPRILAMVPSFLYALTRDGIAVNQYVASAAKAKLASGNELTIRQVSEYPAGETVAIEVSPARPERFALRLRLPSWCEKPAIAVNGQPVADELTPRSYAVLAREWKQGDRVELTLPMQARWTAGRQGNDGLYALVRGPVVYALDTVWCDEPTRRALVGDAKGDPFPGLSGVLLDSDALDAVLAPDATPKRALGPAVRVRIALAGGGIPGATPKPSLGREASDPGMLKPELERGTLANSGTRAFATMLPFANIGTWYRSEAERAERRGRRDAYAVWLPAATSGRFRSVDLRRAANVHSNDGRGLFVSPAYAADCFPFPRYGAYSLRGIPFEIIDPAQNGGKNLVILKGGPPEAIASRYPAGVTIPVGMRCRALHVLGGVAGWAFPWSPDRRVGAIVRIRYEDAPTQEVQWVSGEQLCDYNGKADVPGSQRVLDLGRSHLRLLRIPTNPKGKIAQIEIATTGTIVAPVVAAITAELPADPGE